MTPPYTGSSNATRSFDFNSKRDFQKLKNVHSKMKLLIQNLQQIQPMDFNQFVRGQLYITIDSILHCGSPIERSENQREIFSTLSDFILLFIKYITYLPYTFADYIQGRRVNPNLFLTHPKIAIASAHAELLDLIRKIFGFHSKPLPFFETNQNY